MTDVFEQSDLQRLQNAMNEANGELNKQKIKEEDIEKKDDQYNERLSTLTEPFAQEFLRKPVEDINAEMKTIEGVRYLLWLALRKHQPKIDLIAAGNLIAIDNMTDVGVLIDKLMSSPGEAKKETPAKPNPTEKV